MRIPQFKTCLLPWLLIATLCSPSDALATDYFVRKTGSDGNAGTSAGTAWLTVDYATDNVAAGDTIYVGAGTYVEDVYPAISGTVGNPIKYIADTDGAQTGDAGDVILSSPAGLRALYIFSRDYIEVYNFKISGGSSQVVYWRDSVGGVLENCEVYNGGVYGVYLNTNAELVARDCNIHDNGSASGAGFIVNGSSTLEATDCTISDNYRGCFAIGDTTTFLRCRFENNSTYGILCQGGAVTAKNCLITGGMSAQSVMANGDPANNVTLQNCTIADGSNNGIRCYGGVFAVTNCVIANNAAYGIAYSGGTLTRTNNLLHGNTGGEYFGTTQDGTEIVDDPLFVSSTDYRLRTLSPAIDAGTDLTGTVDDDIDGTPRPDNSAWDIGCYEMAPDGHWKLDETSGTTAVDSSSRGYDGTYMNTPTLGGAGVFGNAAEFDGVNEHVEVASLTSLDNPKAITAACWAKSGTATWSDYGMLISKRNQFIISPTPGTMMLTWYVIDDGGVSQTLAYNLGAIPGFDLQDWHHYACTYDPDLGIQAMYVDGVLINSISRTFTINSDTGSLFIGRDDGWSRYLDGMIDDVRVYTYALNAAEIALLADDSGLVAHWKLDETTGTVAVDSSTFGNDGTWVASPSWSTSGVLGGALDFETSDGADRVDAGNFDVTGNEITLAAWVRQEDLLNDGRIIMKAADNSGSNESWGFTIDETGELDFRIVAGGTRDRLLAPGVILPDIWYHIVGTYDGTTMRLYLDGQLIGTLVHSVGGAIVGNSGHTVTLGDTVSGGRPFDGLIDDVRVYSRKITDVEISELYGLMGHWKMDEGSGSTAADSTPFANDATLYGATWTTDCAGNSGLEFDGVADTAATNADFDPPERGAVAFWFRSDGAPAIWQSMWGVGINFEMWQGADGLVAFDLSTDGFTGGFITTDPLDMEDRWYHLIAEYDSDDDSYAIYINGELHKSGISAAAMDKQTANTLTFGVRTGITQYFDGGIRDFRIYNRSLTPSEKSELSGLAAYWKLDETSGSVAVDSSSNGHDGTLVGSPTWTTAGNIDGSLDFEIDDGVDRVDAGTFNVGGSAISVSAWVRPEDGVFDGRIIFKSTANDIPDQDWGLVIDESQELDFRIKAGGARDMLQYSGSMSPGKWFFVVGTYDGTTMRLYINGVEVANMLHSVGGALDEDSTATVTLGDSPIGDRAYDGRIDDARIFSRALCPTEIYGQYKSGRPDGIRITKWVEVR